MDRMGKYKDEIYGDRIILKQIQEEDIDEYYMAGFSFEDKEVDRLTGNKMQFTKEFIKEYVKRISKDENRYDFLILDKDRSFFILKKLTRLFYFVRTLSFIELL